MADRGNADPFDARTIIWVVVAGLVAFAGFVLLTAFAPKWDRSGDGGTNVLSKSAVGFAGLHRLAELTRRPVFIGTQKTDWLQSGLVIVTIGQTVDLDDLDALVATRRSVPDSKTLYVLPKWDVVPLPARRGFVQSTGTIDPRSLDKIMQKLGSARIEQGRPGSDNRIQGVAGEEMAGVDVSQPLQPRYLTAGMVPLLTDRTGRMILGRTSGDDDTYEYVLADPDLLANSGLKTPDGAAAALAIVDALRADESDSVAFDAVLAGLSDKRNLLQLMFEPPFLAFTLALVVAAILAGLHGLTRFGPPAVEGRAIPFGKRALADNVATLVARAGRERALGDRYVAVIRETVAAKIGASAMAPDRLEARLASLPGGFTDLAAAARAAPDTASLLRAAASLFQWKKDVTRDR